MEACTAALTGMSPFELFKTFAAVLVASAMVAGTVDLIKEKIDKWGSK